MSKALEKNLSTAFLWQGRAKVVQEGDHIDLDKIEIVEIWIKI